MLAFAAEHLPEAIEGEEGEAVGLDGFAQFIGREARRDQLFLGVDIDPHIAGEAQGWRGDADVDFAGAAVAQQLDQGADGGASHDGVVDQHHAAIAQDGLDGVVFLAHALLAQGLVGLDEGASGVIAFDQAFVVGERGRSSQPQCSGDRRLGDGDDQVGVDGGFAPELSPEALAHAVNAVAPQLAVGSGEVDPLEDAEGWGRGGHLGQRGEALGVDAQQLSWRHLTQHLGAHGFQGTALRGEGVACVEGAQAQGPKAQGIA